MGFKSSFIGEGDRFNYGQLCAIDNPCSKNKTKHKVNFYSKDEKIPYLLGAIMGLQHCFAMVGGLITPPLVVFRFTVCEFPGCPDLEGYAVSAALIACGINSYLNLCKFQIPFIHKCFGRDMYFGSGVLSVLGTSFTFLPIFEIGIQQQKQIGIDGEVAYGAMLGTSCVCCILELFFSFCPINFIKKIFPPLITSITVILLGIGLCGSGMKAWGGGAVCADMGWKNHAQLANANVTNLPPPTALCANGETRLLYGSPEYIGLGFSVLMTLVVIEIFGSVFMKNCNVIIALCMGYIIAAVTDYQGLRYVNSQAIAEAPAITFLWVETFPLGFYGPAVVPLCVAYLVTTVETVGDLSATFEASQLDRSGDFYATSLQGGLTADGTCSILACLMTSMPNTTFSQNNGVISMTKCASRRAGYFCAMWMFLLGVFGKFAGIIVAIPDCVLGGMTLFLFANVLTSGINLTHSVDLDSRRNKFIFALSMAVGVGVTVWPFAFLDMRASPYTAAFWPCADCTAAMQGVRDGVSIFLSTGYCVGTVIAMLLNSVLPEDAGVAYADDGDPLTIHVHDVEAEEKHLDETKEPKESDGNEDKASMDEVEEEAPITASEEENA